ncbi:hypothetical protein Bbelb_388950 [Branchiostoma belcheri]|nr:hypothetical protein Bbelb_388950 [Branchiostoma belcheri]
MADGSRVEEEEDCRPVFLVLGNVVNRDRGDRFLSEEEIFSAVAATLGQDLPAPEPIKCIQIARGLCRIYIEGKVCRAKALTKGLALRGKTVTLHEKNPFVKFPRGTRLTVKGLPWSVHDSVIKQALEQKYGCEVTGIQHCRIRVNGRLTNCCNGDRFVFVTSPKKTIPNYNVQMGKFKVNIFYKQSDMMRPESVEQEGVHPRPLQQVLNSQEDFPPLQHSAHVPRILPQDAEETSLSESEVSSCQQENIVNRSNHTEMQSKSDTQMPSDMSMDEEEADITAVNTVAEKEKRGERSGMRQTSATPRRNGSQSSKGTRGHKESTEERDEDNIMCNMTPTHVESGLRALREGSGARNTNPGSLASSSSRRQTDANPVEQNTSRRGQSRLKRNMNAAPVQTRTHQPSKEGGHNPEEARGENRFISTTPPANWFRYVDDTWCRLKKRVAADFFDHINQIDDNIKFTQEPSHDNMLPFLDTKTIVEEDGNLRFEMYRKPTHTDQYLAFDSHHPLENKLAVIKTLFHRADNIITSDQAKTDEHRHLRGALAKCGYQNWTFNKALKPSDQSKKTQKCKPLTNKNKANITIPLKCEEPNCNNTYIGETSRPLKVRYKEHCRPSANGYSSAIFNHLQHNQGHSFKLESTDILDRETRWWERGVKEAIYERMYNPTLNREGGLRVDLSGTWDLALPAPRTDNT